MKFFILRYTRKTVLKSYHRKKTEQTYDRKIVDLEEIKKWSSVDYERKTHNIEVKYKHENFLNDKISIYIGDITDLRVDAIVNLTNINLSSK